MSVLVLLLDFDEDLPFKQKGSLCRKETCKISLIEQMLLFVLFYILLWLKMLDNPCVIVGLLFMMIWQKNNGLGIRKLIYLTFKLLYYAQITVSNHVLVDYRKERKV